MDADNDQALALLLGVAFGPAGATLDEEPYYTHTFSAPCTCGDPGDCAHCE